MGRGRACEARALHTRGSRLRRFARSEKGRKRLFCSLIDNRTWNKIYVLPNIHGLRMNRQFLLWGVQVFPQLASLMSCFPSVLLRSVPNYKHERKVLEKL